MPGDNPDGNGEIFLLDLPTATFTQLTRTTDYKQPGQPTISGDGAWVAFTSTADLSGDNPGGLPQIFLYRVDTGALTQASAGGGNQPLLDADGSTLLYVDTDGWLTRYDVASGQTDTFVQGILPKAIDAAGRRVAYDSTADPLGDNPDGNREIFLYDLATGAYEQITETTGDWGDWTCFNPALSASGDLVAFVSTADLVAGGNPDANHELFVHDRTAGTTRQLTTTQGVDQTLVATSGDGSRVACTVEDPSNPSTSNLHMYDLTTGSRLVITEVQGRWPQAPALSADGGALAFVSEADLLRTGKSRRFDLFLATCPRNAMMLEGDRFRVQVGVGHPPG